MSPATTTTYLPPTRNVSVASTRLIHRSSGHMGKFVIVTWQTSSLRPCILRRCQSIRRTSKSDGSMYRQSELLFQALMVMAPMFKSANQRYGAQPQKSRPAEVRFASEISVQVSIRRHQSWHRYGGRHVPVCYVKLQDSKHCFPVHPLSSRSRALRERSLVEPIRAGFSVPMLVVTQRFMAPES